MKPTKFGRILRKCSLFSGISLLMVSIYLSYDGFDGSLNGNGGYQAIAIFIGVIFAFSVSVIQFIFTNEYSKLNPTLIVVGILSYCYSIYTNKLGASHLLGMSGWMAWFTAAMSDIVAEPMISWGLGESLVGDLLGNLWKAISDDDEPKTNRQPQMQTQREKYIPKHKPAHMHQEPTYHNLHSVKTPPIMRGEDFFRRNK